jgi:tetratricopeptide (TPR) repeat protein
MRSCPLERFHNYFGLKKIARCGFHWEKTTKAFSASVYTYCETALIVASVAALLTFAAGASAQTQGGAQGDNGQSIPDAPQPQKKPAPKPPPPDSSDSHPTPPADDSAPKQSPAKDDNAFPEAVSRQAAKAASDAAKPPAGDDNAFPEAVSRDAAKAASDAAGKTAPDGGNAAKHPADDNPFPEAVSREAAKAAGNDQGSPTPKTDLPPGVSSSQSSDALGDAENPTGRRQLPNPGRAKKDAEVGGFYLNQGNYQGALERYQEAMAIDPTNVDAIFGLAQSQQMLNKNADAARNYQLYLDIVPNGPKAKQALKALKTLQPGNQANQ